jgi:hypothetical protein
MRCGAARFRVQIDTDPFELRGFRACDRAQEDASERSCPLQSARGLPAGRLPITG